MPHNQGRDHAGILLSGVFGIAMLLNACSGGTSTTPIGGTDTTHVSPVDSSGVATSVGSTTGSAVTKVIGPGGGTLTSGDGRITLTIPANALTSAISISVQPITNTGPGGVGAGYRLLPDGQTFATPIQLTFQHTDAELEGSIPDLLGVAYQEAAGYWDELPGGTYNAGPKTLTVSTSHFTDYILVVSIRLVPGRASIKVGASVGLTAVDCSYLAGTRRRLRNCVVGLFTVNGWAVNGAPGGTSGLGLVSGNTLTGTYRAPIAVPSPSTVAVSANVVGGLRDGSQSTLTLLSNVTITEDAWYGTTATNGTTNVNGSPYSSATIKWVLFSKEGAVSTYLPNGTVTAGVVGCTLTPSTHTLTPQSDGRLVVDESGAVATYRGVGTSVWAASLVCAGITAPVYSASYLGGAGGEQGVEAVGSVDQFGFIAGSVVRSGILFTWGFSRTPS